MYVLGGFKNQGLVPITGNSPLTLLQITALSGGPDKDAKYDDLRLIRTNGGKRTFVKLDIKRVMNGKDPDPILQADDILYMPPSSGSRRSSTAARSTCCSRPRPSSSTS